MKSIEEIKRAIVAIEEQMPKLAEGNAHREMLGLYGILDALKWVCDEESYMPGLLGQCKSLEVKAWHNWKN